MGSKNTKDFKRDALRMRERTGVSVTAEKLGMSVKLLYIWRREERLERGEAPKVLRPGETAKQGCKRLERENEELREANYILKRAMGLMKERLTEAIAKALTPIQAQRIRAVYIDKKRIHLVAADEGVARNTVSARKDQGNDGAGR